MFFTYLKFDTQLYAKHRNFDLIMLKKILQQLLNIFELTVYFLSTSVFTQKKFRFFQKTDRNFFIKQFLNSSVSVRI